MTKCTPVGVPRYPPPANSVGFASRSLRDQPKWMEPLALLGGM